MLALKPLLLEPSRYLAKSQGHAADAFTGGAAFQVFGFDVMVDTAGQPYLLEVNSNPSMDVSAVLPLPEDHPLCQRPTRGGSSAGAAAAASDKDRRAAIREQYTRTSLRTRVKTDGHGAAEALTAGATGGATGGATDGATGAAGETVTVGDEQEVKVCRCMDSHLPHSHRICPVDLSVKSSVLGGALAHVFGGETFRAAPQQRRRQSKSTKKKKKKKATTTEKLGGQVVDEKEASPPDDDDDECDSVDDNGVDHAVVADSSDEGKVQDVAEEAKEEERQALIRLWQAAYDVIVDEGQGIGVVEDSQLDVLDDIRTLYEALGGRTMKSFKFRKAVAGSGAFDASGGGLGGSTAAGTRIDMAFKRWTTTSYERSKGEWGAGGIDLGTFSDLLMEVAAMAWAAGGGGGSGSSGGGGGASGEGGSDPSSDDSDGSATDEDEHDDDGDDGEAGGPTAEEVRTFIAGMLEAAGA